MIALVLAGGDLTPNARLRHLAKEASLVIAADSGLTHASTLGVSPDLIVGDFDSVTPQDLQRYPNTPHSRHPTQKNDLDLELAAKEALNLGASHLRLMGVIGSRLDQSLGGLLIAAKLHKERVPTTVHTIDTDVHFISQNESLRPTRPAGTLFSVLSLSPKSAISIRGANYPLDNHLLAFGVGQGISNLSTSGLEVHVKEGLVALLLQDDSLATEVVKNNSS
ncbi:MAG: thiamine diphosphokinase [Deinococcales bacterium]|nr:thiamine diphosphokinase [Deinococcales bacterium]